MSQCFLYSNCNHKDCDRLCQRKIKLSYLLETSRLPESNWVDKKLCVDSDGTDIAEFNQLAEIKTKIVSFVKNGANLYLHSSNSGNGKTSWAAKLALTYLDRTWKSYDFSECAILFVDVPNFLDKLKQSFSNPSTDVQQMLNNIAKADLVIWDDIAAKSGTEYEINKLLGLINDRIVKNKANIYTSNLNTNQVYDALGSRLASRICNYSIDIELHGADKRCLGRKEF